MKFVYLDHNTAVALCPADTGYRRESLVSALWLRLTGKSSVDLHISRQKNGRPQAVVDGTRCLSVSFAYAGARFLVALCLEGNVGVDLGRPDSIQNWVEVAETFYSPKEIAWLSMRSTASYAQSACRLWTRKEAVAKCLGDGLTWIEKREPVTFDRYGQIQIKDLPMEAGWAAALASSTKLSAPDNSAHVCFAA